MHLSHITQQTIRHRIVHISFLCGTLWDMGQMLCGIYDVDLLHNSFHGLIPLTVTSSVANRILAHSLKPGKAPQLVYFNTQSQVGKDRCTCKGTYTFFKQLITDLILVMYFGLNPHHGYIKINVSLYIHLAILSSEKRELSSSMPISFTSLIVRR